MSDTPTLADPVAEARKALAKTEEAPRHVHSWRLVCDRGHEVAGSSAETEPPHWATWADRREGCEECAANHSDDNAYDVTVLHNEWDWKPVQTVGVDHLRATLAAYDAEHAARVAAEGEVARLRAGGCARDQRTTQFCAEAVDAIRERDTLRTRIAELERAAEEERARVTRIIRAQADAYLALHGGGGEYCHALSGALDSIYPTENT